MAPETRKCNNCKKNFQIFPEDFAFYEKMKVPAPTWCPQCREMRRWSFRNERYLYSRQCDKCKKSIISIWSQDKSRTVYCRECFNSDDFDPVLYGRDVDFSRPFFEQFHELFNSVPVVALIGGTNSINSDYINLETDDKNCYMNVGGHYNEDCYYNTFSLYGKNNVDNYFVFKCELVYESSDCHNCYRCFYCRNVVGSNDCWMCYDCRNCTNCFGCVNQRNKQYMIYNEQLSREEYEKRIAELTNGFRSIEDAKKRFERELLKHPRRFAFVEKSENSAGDYLTQCRDAVECFNVEDGENVKFMQIAGYVKDCMDGSAIGQGELFYEVVGVGVAGANALFSGLCFPSIHEIRYCLFCRNSDNLFGCVSLKKNSFCILNKHYSKEEYEILLPKIIDHMKINGEWGEFFPTRISPFGYNETVAQLYFPLSRELANEKGYPWKDDESHAHGKETLKLTDMPDSIDEIDISGMMPNGKNLTKEVISCMECGKNYKIIAPEFSFYKRLCLPIPHRCPHCRYELRMKLRGINHVLYTRHCACDKTGHDHEGHCSVQFETIYAPDRPEIIYCEQCYQKEMV